MKKRHPESKVPFILLTGELFSSGELVVFFFSAIISDLTKNNCRTARLDASEVRFFSGRWQHPRDGVDAESAAAVDSYRVRAGAGLRGHRPATRGQHPPDGGAERTRLAGRGQ